MIGKFGLLICELFNRKGAVLCTPKMYLIYSKIAFDVDYKKQNVLAHFTLILSEFKKQLLFF